MIPKIWIYSILWKYSINIFGNNPKEVYLEDKLYQSGLTNTDLIQKLNNININDPLMICDSAVPALFKELRQAGFKVREAEKNVS
jgi:hypothetical protein